MDRSPRLLKGVIIDAHFCNHSAQKLRRREVPHLALMTASYAIQEKARLEIPQTASVLRA